MDYPYLVRLNPNIPWKTRGNGAVCIHFKKTSIHANRNRIGGQGSGLDQYGYLDIGSSKSNKIVLTNEELHSNLLRIKRLIIDKA